MTDNSNLFVNKYIPTSKEWTDARNYLEILKFVIMLLTQLLFLYIEYTEIYVNGLDEYLNDFFNIFDFS